MENLILIFALFFILTSIAIFPYFRQTKKNLVWLVFIFLSVSALMIADFGLEFLSLSYLLIYVGAVAVMFLFVIVAVDPKRENQIEWFEKSLALSFIFNNFLTSIVYFIFLRGSSFPSLLGTSYLFNIKMLLTERLSGFCNEFFLSDGLCMQCRGRIAEKTHLYDFLLNSGCIWDDLSLYNFLEYRTKDVFIFSEYFYKTHGFLLIAVGMILTISMLVSLLIAKEFSLKKTYEA